MKKAGEQTKNRFPPELYVFAVLVAVSFSALVVSTQNILNIRNAGFSAFSGVRGGVTGVSSFVSNTVLAVRELARLREDYNELMERLAGYERLERTAAEINQENARLREQLGFSQSLSFKHIPAVIVGRDPDNLFSALVVNKGSRAGVSVDMPVIAWQGGSQALVGMVIEARPFESLVVPLYNSNLYVSARLAVSRFEGIVEGRGNADRDLRMRYIPKRAAEDISIGDMVVTSGMGGIYPPDINIGRVSGISYVEHEISMELDLSPLIDFSRLEHVFVIGSIDTEEDLPGGNPDAGAAYSGQPPSADETPPVADAVSTVLPAQTGTAP
jgi:rod shape-determining protein MreC